MQATSGRSVANSRLPQTCQRSPPLPIDPSLDCAVSLGASVTTCGGYDGLVTAPDWHEGDPAAFSNSLPISSILHETIQLPVFDDVNDLSGSNMGFHVTEFVSVRITAHKSNGNQAGRYLDIRFLTAAPSTWA